MEDTMVFEPKTAELKTEDFFRQTLVLERKRTERSGRPFLVVLLDVEQLLKDPAREPRVLVETLTSALSASTRDIDVKGWYRINAMIGIICTEVTRSMQDLVVAKIKKRLVTGFDPLEVGKMGMYLIHYPDFENATGRTGKTPPIPELWPERKGVFFS
ncbi:MAG TPA: hypothetical protein VLX68_14960 [Chitinivibrionales bacterium]|nr:hypothetical protein [Chitinivibrionales bacterium]